MKREASRSGTRWAPNAKATELRELLSAVVKDTAAASGEVATPLDVSLLGIEWVRLPEPLRNEEGQPIQSAVLLTGTVEQHQINVRLYFTRESSVQSLGGMLDRGGVEQYVLQRPAPLQVPPSTRFQKKDIGVHTVYLILGDWEAIKLHSRRRARAL